MSSFEWPPIGSGVYVYANLASFPAAFGGGSLAVALDTNIVYEDDSVAIAWKPVASNAAYLAALGAVLTVGTIDTGVASANGAHIIGTSLIMQSASGSVPGLVNLTSQTFLGQKTFTTGLTGTLTGAASLNVLTSALGTLSDAGTDGITVTGGVGAVVGSVSLSQHVADTTHNGYLSSTDWNTFNGKQAALTFGNLTDVGTDGITVTNGAGAVIGTGTSFAQHVADTTHNGYLSSTDWNTFNGKQGTISIGSLDAQAANATGLALVANVLSAQSADATHPGLVNTTTQTFAGQKTFSTGLTGTLTGHASLDVATSSLGTVTEATSSVLTLTGWTNATVGSPTILVKQASTSVSGYLSNTDWNTFNGKGSGTVTSVSASGPSGIATWSAAVTGSGTLTQTLSTQTQNLFLASPNGSTGTPSFRAVVAADLPTAVPGTSAGIIPSAGLPANITGTTIAAGYVGRAFSGTTSTPALSGITNCGSITIPAGCWMIYGTAGFSWTTGPLVNYFKVGISLANNTLPATQYTEIAWLAGTNIADICVQNAPFFFAQVTTNTTYYLNAQVAASGTGLVVINPYIFAVCVG